MSGHRALSVGLFLVLISSSVYGRDRPAAREAFKKAHAVQCGYCTPGQICSATAMLEEFKAGWPSNVSGSLTASPELTDDEISERMSGNICRCAAYPNIVDAIRETAKGQS